jgi:predicted nucleic acid-binding Zn ribbon protein
MASKGKTVFKCPFCDQKYIALKPKDKPNAKKSLYEHMEIKHYDDLNGLSPAQVYFNWKYKKDHGSCVICGKETKWNESTERYERFCSEKCKQKYREEFKKRMKDKYGKEHLLDDPEVQKKMLSKRKISGKYTWSTDKKIKIPYVGSYDIVMHYEGTDVIGPAPQIFEYKYEGKVHFYIPDFYIQSLNLILEVKDGGENPNKHPKIQKVDKEKERLKDQVMKKQTKYNYLKITDKDYSILLNYLFNLKYSDD